MQHFVNEYEYTPDILQESIGAWWDYKYKDGYRSMLAVFILIAVLSIVMKRPVFLVAELVPLFVVVLFRFKKKKSIQIEQERIDILFRGTDLFCRVEVGEDISFTSLKGNRRIQFSDVENYLETRNLIVLFIKGSMTISLDKKGFREGTKEDFMSLLANTVK
ncbi:MAG: YcxB family protein [Lachnospiraceae bacterium]|nr:YcxB family protein [Lachnospiraceae bacterium]